MNPESTPAWLALLELQSGVVSRGQALGHGLDDDIIENRLRSGRWRAAHRGVYATFSGRLSREAVLWAAVLRAGPGGLALPRGRRPADDCRAAAGRPRGPA
jgi:hypothetical protein